MQKSKNKDIATHINTKNQKHEIQTFENVKFTEIQKYKFNNLKTIKLKFPNSSIQNIIHPTI